MTDERGRRWADMEATAAYSGLTERQLRRLREYGRIPSYNPSGGKVLFDLDEIDDWIAASADPRPAATTADELKAASRSKARNARRRRTS